MQRIEPKALTTPELLCHVYAMNFNVPVSYVEALYDRLCDAAETTILEKPIDPRQLELPL